MKGVLRVGTSNVVLPGNKLSFPVEYRQRTRLHYYSTIFNTVEVNSSFYRLPLPSTFRKWAGEVNEDFQFSVKISKDLTHAKDLRFDLGQVEKFLRAASVLGRNRGCLLIQFPGKINLKYFAEVQALLEEISSHHHEYPWRKAIEFRDRTWDIRETTELLNDYDASQVLQDIPKSRMMEAKGTADFVYLRFHGPKGDYRDSYSTQFLESMAEEAKQWLADGKDVYAYFNNTIGSAYENAIAFKDMIP